jgi:membrane protein required for beta-lactamase induction
MFPYVVFVFGVLEIFKEILSNSEGLLKEVIVRVTCWGARNKVLEYRAQSGAGGFK